MVARFLCAGAVTGLSTPTPITRIDNDNNALTIVATDGLGRMYALKLRV